MRGCFWRQDLAIVPQVGLDFVPFLPQPPMVELQVCTTRILKKNLSKIILFLCFAGVRTCIGKPWHTPGGQSNFEASVLSYHPEGPGDQILVVRLGSKCLNPLSSRASLLEHLVCVHKSNCVPI